MNNPGTATKRTFQLPWRDKRPQADQDVVKAALQSSFAREAALHREIKDLLRRQSELAEEFDHRLLNSISMIASLLSAQSRIVSPEAAAQLTIAVNRIAAFGHVHRQLHLLDHQEHVEFKQFLEHLCDRLSSLLFRGSIDDCSIVVEGTSCRLPTTLGSPLGFIVSELITNSAKHGKGKIIVRFETPSPHSHVISVTDDGPGLPAEFRPDECKGLGMKIVQGLVKQIDGELLISRGEPGAGAQFAISFSSPQERPRWGMSQFGT
jgi:two-component sensor histidine kinase